MQEINGIKIRKSDFYKNEFLEAMQEALADESAKSERGLRDYAFAFYGKLECFVEFGLMTLDDCAEVRENIIKTFQMDSDEFDNYYI